MDEPEKKWVHWCEACKAWVAHVNAHGVSENEALLARIATLDTALAAVTQDRDEWIEVLRKKEDEYERLETALAASRAEVEGERHSYEVIHQMMEDAVNENEGIREKLRDAERARDDARELVALEFERGKLCGIAEEREHAEQFKARWFHQTTQEAIARAEHAEQRVAGLEAALREVIEQHAGQGGEHCANARARARAILTPPPVAPSAIAWCPHSPESHVPGFGQCEACASRGPIAPSGG